MKQLLRGAAALVTLSALALPTAHAKAQDIGNRIILKGGVFNATKGTTKNVGGNWWTLGAEYQLQDPEATSVNSVEFLYSAKNETVQSAGSLGVPTRYRGDTLFFQHKMRMTGEGVPMGNVFFYGAGLGLDFVRIKVEDPNPGGEGTFDTRRTVGAADIFAGYEIASNFQIEAKYQLTSKVQGRNLDGWMLLAGVRF